MANIYVETNTNISSLTITIADDVFVYGGTEGSPVTLTVDADFQCKNLVIGGSVLTPTTAHILPGRLIVTDPGGSITRTIKIQGTLYQGYRANIIALGTGRMISQDSHGVYSLPNDNMCALWLETGVATDNWERYSFMGEANINPADDHPYTNAAEFHAIPGVRNPIISNLNGIIGDSGVGKDVAKYAFECRPLFDPRLTFNYTNANLSSYKEKTSTTYPHYYPNIQPDHACCEMGYTTDQRSFNNGMIELASVGDWSVSPDGNLYLYTTVPAFTLDGGIDDTTTTVVVNEDISGMPAAGWFNIDSELFRYTSKDDGTKTFTVLRGEHITYAAGHLTGAVVTAGGFVYSLEMDNKFYWKDRTLGAGNWKAKFETTDTLQVKGQGNWRYGKQVTDGARIKVANILIFATGAVAHTWYMFGECNMSWVEFINESGTLTATINQYCTHNNDVNNTSGTMRTKGPKTYTHCGFSNWLPVGTGTLGSFMSNYEQQIIDYPDVYIKLDDVILAHWYSTGGPNGCYYKLKDILVCGIVGQHNWGSIIEIEGLYEENGSTLFSGAYIHLFIIKNDSVISVAHTYGWISSGALHSIIMCGTGTKFYHVGAISNRYSISYGNLEFFQDTYWDWGAGGALCTPAANAGWKGVPVHFPKKMYMNNVQFYFTGAMDSYVEPGHPNNSFGSFVLVEKDEGLVIIAHASYATVITDGVMYATAKHHGVQQFGVMDMPWILVCGSDSIDGVTLSPVNTGVVTHPATTSFMNYPPTRYDDVPIYCCNVRYCLGQGNFHIVLIDELSTIRPHGLASDVHNMYLIEYNGPGYITATALMDLSHITTLPHLTSGNDRWLDISHPAIEDNRMQYSISNGMRLLTGANKPRGYDGIRFTQNGTVVVAMFQALLKQAGDVTVAFDIFSEDLGAEPTAWATVTIIGPGVYDRTEFYGGYAVNGDFEFEKTVYPNGGGLLFVTVSWDQADSMDRFQVYGTALEDPIFGIASWATLVPWGGPIPLRDTGYLPSLDGAQIIWGHNF